MPAGTPVFPVYEPTAAPKPALPSTDQIIARYIEALGGEQALRRVTGRIVTGTQYIPTGPGEVVEHRVLRRGQGEVAAVVGAAVGAGAGIKKGFVYGKSDKTASSPLENPVHPTDLLATIYHLAGINPGTIINNHLNQPRELVKWSR